VPLTAEQQAQAETFLPNVRGEVWRLKQRVPSTVDVEELHAAALLALTQAIERWPVYCAGRGTDPADPDAAKFLPIYVKQRVVGALLDHLRSLDWCTRSERVAVKALQEAERDHPGSALAEQAESAGIGVDEARAALAAAERRPVSLDETLKPADGETYITDACLVDQAPSADVEGQAVVRDVLSAARSAIWALDELTRWVLVYRYYEGLKLREVAEVLGIERDECREHWEAGITAVHAAMLQAADAGCPCGNACTCGAA
jgi:RNA polymerase sigma factor FliA